MLIYKECVTDLLGDEVWIKMPGGYMPRKKVNEYMFDLFRDEYGEYDDL